MNEELQTQIAGNLESIFSYLEQGIKTGVDFGSEQIPLLIQEILTYNLVENAFVVGIGLLLLIIGFSYLFFDRKGIAQLLGNDVVSSSMFSIIAGILCSAMGIVVFFSNIFTLFKIYFAPRLFLIEYLSNLIN